MRTQLITLSSTVQSASRTLTSDYRTMIERPEQIIGGLKVMLQLFDNAKGVIGIENNKPEAIKKLTEMVATSRDRSMSAAYQVPAGW